MDIHHTLLASAFAREGMVMSNQEFASWFEARQMESEFEVKHVPIDALDGWHLDSGHNLTHHTGRFFSVEGLDVLVETPTEERRWMQPIMRQPEVGILGLLAQRRRGVLHFLMQAKKEPGNVNGLQLSPCVQATRSNYSRVHNGKATAYLDYFVSHPTARTVVDQLQSEHNARFLKKRNRNVVVQLPDDEAIETRDGFCWLTLGQLKHLMRTDNLINMNARTVLGCLPFPSSGGPASPFADRFEQALYTSLVASKSWKSIPDVFGWLTRHKCDTRLVTRLCSVRDVEGWRLAEGIIAHEGGRYFDVIGVDVRLNHREIAAWQQPLLRQRNKGLVGMILKPIEGVLHMLVRARTEAGNIDLVEVGATVQCVPDRIAPQQEPFLEWFTELRGTVRYDVVQSEEGGRFFHDQNRNVALEVGEDFPLNPPPDFIWLTLGQVKHLIQFSNVLNIGARSLMAALSPV
ncbi:MAG: NDP-hexose 2,3-dehydratase family protein [Myxococcota bacterium]